MCCSERVADIMMCESCKQTMPMFDGNGMHNFAPHYSQRTQRIVQVCIKCKLKDWQRPPEGVGWGAARIDFAECNNPGCKLPPNKERSIESKAIGECDLIIVRGTTWQKHIYKFHCQCCGNREEEVFESQIAIKDELLTFCPFCGRMSDRHRASEVKFVSEQGGATV